MHPNRAFRWDEDEALAFAIEAGFAHIFACTPDGPMVAHAPIVPGEGRALHFHLAHANRITQHLDGGRALLSVAGANGYVSPSFYADTRNQVPTWNYLAVEIEGTAHRLREDALIAQLDALAAAHEPRVSPDKPWTRDKLDDAPFRKLLAGIVGFELRIQTVRSTRKLGQHKSPADTAGAVAGLERSGNHALAAAMAEMMR